MIALTENGGYVFSEKLVVEASDVLDISKINNLLGNNNLAPITEGDLDRDKGSKGTNCLSAHVRAQPFRRQQ